MCYSTGMSISTNRVIVATARMIVTSSEMIVTTTGVIVTATGTIITTVGMIDRHPRDDRPHQCDDRHHQRDDRHHQRDDRHRHWDDRAASRMIVTTTMGRSSQSWGDFLSRHRNKPSAGQAAVLEQRLSPQQNAWPSCFIFAAFESSSSPVLGRSRHIVQRLSSQA